MRRISTKLVLLVLAAVALPFLGFAVYMDQAVTLGFTRRVTEQALKGLAGDLAARLDARVTASREGLVLLAQQPMLSYAAQRRALYLDGDATAGPDEFRDEVESAFDARLAHGDFYSLLVLVDYKGRFVASNQRDAGGILMRKDFLDTIAQGNYQNEDWYKEGIQGRTFAIGQHKSRLMEPVVTDPADAYHLGFAVPVHAGRAKLGDPPVAVLFGLAPWRPFQEVISAQVVKETFRGLVRPGEDPSPYAWIWDSSANVILAHQDISIYGTRITEDLGLGSMTRDVMEDEDGWGMYSPYEFRGVEKTAAFKRSRGPDEGGFGWVVGVGIDDEDMFATSKDLQTVLRGGTVFVLLTVLLGTMVVARRMTRPIHDLQELTRRVAGGDLAARLEPTTKDELGALTRDFNAMTERIAEQREQLIKAEKDAAWREMARQIAHDIKNPLTPIKISVDLLRTSHAEASPQFDRIFERTMEMMDRQVSNLREISRDFYEFTGGRRPEPEHFDVHELVDEVLDLHAAWAEEAGVDLQKSGPGGALFVDRGKLRRVLENLITNAFHALVDGQGAIVVHCEQRGGRVFIEVRDSGSGISAEAREHLFEPYFTTRGEGTGLGLAIASRVIEEMGGTIELLSRADHEGAGTPGTLARVELPAAEAAPDA
ncbi:MAG: sensor histidine kinase [Planctomycetota bacterium]|nr:sensor histidine kinase [Planctomycetota bacterium]